MNKKLIALAVVSAFSAPAMAADNGVVIYGQITMSYDLLDTDSQVATDDDKLNRISSNNSRIGFRGKEDLGNGLAGIWQIENQISMDGVSAANGFTQSTSGSSFSNALRNTFVGLKSEAAGTLLFGIHDTPFKMATGKLDIFSDTSGDFNNIVGNINGANQFDLRTNNTVLYMTPNLIGHGEKVVGSGLNLAVAYVAGQEASNGTNPDFNIMSGMALYDMGPLFLSLAYERQNNVNSIPAVAGSAAVCRDITTNATVTCGVANSYVATAPVIAAPGSVGADRSAGKIGLGYKFGNTQLGAVYEKMEDDAANSAASRDAWYASLAHGMGPIVLKAAYAEADDGESAANTAAKSYTLGADYLFSKRTKMYALYSKTDNDSGGTYGVGAAGSSYYTPAAGLDPSVISLGVRHNF